MDFDQLTLLFLLLASLVFFVIGKPRYDMVALTALLIAAFTGIVPYAKAFSGFSHQAVITVIGIFIISAAVEKTGILENLAYKLKLKQKVIWKQVGLLCALVTLTSCIINNVGAVALMIPVALKVARINNIPRGILLMPLAFSSLLGGLITLIGTPPNIIVSQYRHFYRLEYFGFLDFAPVGLMVALCGVLFISVVGWRLIPRVSGDKKSGGIEHERFTVEFVVSSGSGLVDKKAAEIVRYQEGKINFFALIREGEAFAEHLELFKIKSGDVLVIETDKWTLSDFTNEFGLTSASREKIQEDKKYYLCEATVLPHSELVEKTVEAVNLDENYSFVVAAVSRKGKQLTERVGSIELSPGDVILIKSNARMTREQADKLDCVIIEETEIRAVDGRQAAKVAVVFGISISLVVLGILNAGIAFMAAAAAMILSGCVSIDKAYASISWPVIVLLGALIPVGEAMESTGLAKVISVNMYQAGKVFPIWVNLYALIVCTMLLSNVMNNAAVAVVFSPIAATLASSWQASLDPFLMGIAVGASCTFLTPIGHQSNTLVFGAGRYRFTDFWAMGLPLTLIVSVVATMMIILVWPFYPQINN